MKLLESLLEISQEIHKTENLDDFFNNIINIAKKHIKTNHFSVMIENKGFLEVRACSSDVFIHHKVSIENSIVGKVYRTGQEIVLKGDFNLNHKDVDEISAFCCFPIKIGEKNIGVVCFSKDKEEFFSDDEISIIKYIANQSAIAIERHTFIEQKEISDNIKMISIIKSSVAHDISNLLNVIGIYLELLEGEVEKSPQASEYFENIYTELKRVSCLATDMLDYSKEKLVVNKNNFYISELLLDLKRYNRFRVMDTNIKIDYCLDEDFQINADKDRLFRVNFNLINNAVDALKGSGNVVFKIKKVDKQCVFFVWDNGIGIAKENINKLFNPFFTSGKAKGTGLGLAVVDEIVKAHNGKVYVKSGQGKYTCFVIRIPING